MLSFWLMNRKNIIIFENFPKILSTRNQIVRENLILLSTIKKQTKQRAKWKKSGWKS